MASGIGEGAGARWGVAFSLPAVCWVAGVPAAILAGVVPAIERRPRFTGVFAPGVAPARGVLAPAVGVLPAGDFIEGLACIKERL